MVKIIGLSGKIGTGKSYIAENILSVNLPKSIVLCFGDHVKIEYSRLNGTPFEHLFINKPVDVRINLQKYATEDNRYILGENTWIDALDNWIRLFTLRGFESFIIPDVRFENEAEYIKSKGGIIINLYAPERNRKKVLEECGGDISLADKICNHISEQDLPKKYIDIELNNDNVENVLLWNTITKYINKY
jgi:hypothetical protein